MKRTSILLALLGLASCGGDLTHTDGATVSGNDGATAQSDGEATDTGTGSRTDSPVQGEEDAGTLGDSGSSLPEVGSPECARPDSTCAFCSDHRWHCDAWSAAPC